MPNFDSSASDVPFKGPRLELRRLHAQPWYAPPIAFDSSVQAEVLEDRTPENRALLGLKDSMYGNLRSSSSLAAELGGVMTFAPAQSMTGASQPASAAGRQLFLLSEPGAPRLALQLQTPGSLHARPAAASDVVYVHGATFGADLSVFYRFDGRSWADELNDIGLNVWGFDFAGYGGSDRYPPNAHGPVGRMDEAVAQLHRVVLAVRQGNEDRPVALIAHSWGASVAARYAGTHPQDVKALVLFGPIVVRAAMPAATQPAQAPATHLVSLWAQYRRFIEDVPRGQAQVLSEAHIAQWGQAYLAVDPDSSARMPPAVLTPFGPLADIGALWSGQSLYDPSLVKVPTLLIRGVWDGVCTDADATRLLAALGSVDKEGVKIDRATHLMHLESGRIELHNQVNAFLTRTMIRSAIATSRRT